MKKNYEITSPYVVLVDEIDGGLNTVATPEALERAFSKELDLVVVSESDKSGYPVCKILNYGKLVYERKQRLRKKKKEKEQEQKVAASSHNKVKEVQLTTNIGVGDMKWKLGQVVTWLGKGYKIRVKCYLKTRREITNPVVGIDRVNVFIKQVQEMVPIVVDSAPAALGRNVLAELHAKN